MSNMLNILLPTALPTARPLSPFNAEDILEKLEHIFSSQELIEQQVEEAHEVLQSLPSWQEVFRIINSNIEELLIND